MKFSFEELDVWQKAVDFTKLIIDLTDKVEANRKHYRLIEQLEACSTSVALNIAEGKGRYSKKEFVKFLYIARGSLFETVTLLIIFQKNDWITEKQLNDTKGFADEIGKMLSGLINSIKRNL
ncbi:MAG: four helix bundle protein [Candidatus Omnitrophica bacterium]|nr:four helix bundle protein [Candidatus Omnitrophota bacterium]